MPGLTIGPMSTRVTLQRPDPTETCGYADVVTVWADVQAAVASATEVLQSGGTLAAGVRRVRMHYRSDVQASWRAVVCGRVLEIADYGDPDGRRRELALVCREVL